MTKKTHGNFVEPETNKELEQLSERCPISKEYYHYSITIDYDRKPSWDIACNCDVLPAGTYYIGDPCYAIGQSDDKNPDYWINYCKVSFKDRKTSPTAKWNKKKIAIARKRDDIAVFHPDYGIMVTNPEDTSKKPKFYDIAVFGTGGDGSFIDEKSNTGEYSVDAGIIGAVPIEAIPRKLLKRKYKTKRYKWSSRRYEPYTLDGGHIFKFEEDVHCCEKDGHLIFGDKHMFIGIDINPGQHESDAEQAYEEEMEANRPW